MKAYLLVFVLTVLAALGLYGCETLPSKPVEAPYGSKIAAVSLLGSEIRNVRARTTIFSTKWTTSPAPEARIDTYVTSTIGELLRSRSSLKYVRVDESGTALLEGYDRSEISPCCARRFSLERVAGDLGDLRSRYGVDYLLLVVDSSGNDQFGRGLTVAGYGYMTSKFIGPKSAATNFYVELLVVDTQKQLLASMKTIKSFEKIPAMPSEEDYAGLPPEDRHRVLTSLKEQIDNVFEPALKEMKLVN